MMKQTLFVLLFVSFSFSLSVQWEEWEDINIANRKHWRMIEEANPLDEIHVTVGLYLQNTEKFTSILMSVSDPTSPLYGDYLNQQDVYDLSSPPMSSVNLVKDWLEHGNANNLQIRNNGGFITCSFKVIDAISLFSKNDMNTISFYRFQNVRNEDVFITRSLEPIHIPFFIKEKVQVFDGINNFPRLPVKNTPKKPHVFENDNISISIATGDSVASVYSNSNEFSQYSSVNVTLFQGNAVQSVITPTVNGITTATLFTGLANYVPISVSIYVNNNGNWMLVGNYTGDEVFPSVWITPTVVNQLYNIPPGTVSTALGNSQSVAEFSFQFYKPSDLSTFSSLMNLPMPNVTVHGINNASFAGGESTLDIEWITAIGVNVPTIFWYVEHGFLLNWALQVSEDPNPPLVHSISYGEPEQDMFSSIMDRANQEFQLLGARGITIISTSGDLGTSDGTDNCKIDIPDFPSSSPWTTSLGATFITRDTSTSICTGQYAFDLPILCDATAELPCAVDAGTSFTTGGGFSAVFPRPSYQDTAVQEYLNTAVLPPSSYFNSSGRGYNDVGALGFNILTVKGGSIDVTGGTSASGPIFAGLVALLNDVQLNQGKSPLGFINPWLYQTAASNPYAFNPVLSGDNKCKESGELCCTDGFVAQAGWNPLTGLGTPVYGSLKSALP